MISGPCAGGAAYSPTLGDLTLMAGPEARMFLTGPQIIERVTRERISAEDLGGPKVHGRNGVAHLLAPRRRRRRRPRAPRARLPAVGRRRRAAGRAAGPAAGGRPGHVVPERDREVYDVRDVAARILDGGDLLELAPRWARNLVTGFARLDGHPVGLIASQPRHLGGCLDADSAQKGAWFVELCDRYGLPLVVLVDTPGFLPGARQERDGVLRHGAALLRAFSCATVPRVTVTLRQAFGGAHIVMNSRDLGADADAGLAAAPGSASWGRGRPSSWSTGVESRQAPTRPSWPTPTPPSTCPSGGRRRRASWTRSSRPMRHGTG